MKKLKKIYLILIITLTSSCVQDINSNSFDGRFSVSNGIDTSTPAGQRLSDAYDILNNNCMSCHTGYHNKWTGLNTSQKWIDTGVIESRSAYSSTLFIRLKNIGGNMPKDNPQLTDSEINTIIDWIDNI